MGLSQPLIDGQTPLDEDEMDGLKIATITTRGELDQFEQQNIETAMQWVLKQKNLTAEKVLNEPFICSMHVRMYGKVWKWAGDFRKTNKNIGVDKYLIGTELRYLLDDTRYWITNKTFSEDQIAIRFKHRLVSIHCFPNGNGRHSRLMADILVNKVLGQPIFTWGAASNLSSDSPTRKLYLDAVRRADTHIFDQLLAFARS